MLHRPVGEGSATPGSFVCESWGSKSFSLLGDTKQPSDRKFGSLRLPCMGPCQGHGLPYTAHYHTATTKDITYHLTSYMHMLCGVQKGKYTQHIIRQMNDKDINEYVFSCQPYMKGVYVVQAAGRFNIQRVRIA